MVAIEVGVAEDGGEFGYSCEIGAGEAVQRIEEEAVG